MLDDVKAFIDELNLVLDGLVIGRGDTHIPNLVPFRTPIIQNIVQPLEVFSLVKNWKQFFRAFQAFSHIEIVVPAHLRCLC